MVNMYSVAAVYQHLVQTAIERRTTTYSELTELLGRKDNEVVDEEVFSGLGGILNHLAGWLKQQHLPPLTALVVRASGGSKGQLADAFWTSQKLDYLPPHKTSSTRKDISGMFQQQCWDYYAGLSTRAPHVVEAFNAYCQAVAASPVPLNPRLCEVVHQKMSQFDSAVTVEGGPVKPLVYVEAVYGGAVINEPFDKLHWMVEWFETNFEFSEDKRSVVRCKTDILLTEDELRAKAAITEVAILPIASPPIDFVTRVFSRHLNANTKLGLAITGFTVVGVLNDELRNLPFEVKYTGGHRGWNFEIKVTVRNTRDANNLDVIVVELTADPKTGQFQSWCNDERIHAITVEVIAEKHEAV